MVTCIIYFVEQGRHVKACANKKVRVRFKIGTKDLVCGYICGMAAVDTDLDPGPFYDISMCEL